MYKAIIVDDEKPALDIIRILLEKTGRISVVGSFMRAADALSEMQTLKPHVAFLDIEMPDMSGLELAEKILDKSIDTELVFVTAYDKYALEAFEINAIDYLLKPVGEERFKKTIERVLEKVNSNTGKTEKRFGIESKSENKLKINSFGGFQVFDFRGEPIRWRTRKAKELFAYLWIHKEKAIDKTVLMEVIFPDKNFEQAVTLLHTTIYQLRNALKILGCSYGIVYLNGGYQLQIACTSDLDELRKLLATEKLTEEQIHEILRIYHGDFMEEGYSWSIEIQQHYRDIIFKTLEGFCISCLAAKRASSSLKACLDLAYRIDPFGEGAAKLMIRYYGEQGDKSGLMSFYRRHAADLRAEMDIEPPENLKRLYSSYFSNFQQRLV